MQRFFVKDGLYIDVQPFFSLFECKLYQYLGNGEYAVVNNNILLSKEQLLNLVPNYPRY
jgi:hypothetical protein